MFSAVRSSIGGIVTEEGSIVCLRGVVLSGEGWKEMIETEDQDMVAYVFLECGVLMLKM